MEKTVGILGGGQLGRMMAEAANNLGIRVVTLDAASSPAMQVNANSTHVVGSFRDPEAIKQLARQVDVITAEIEHVDTATLEELTSQDKKIQIHPHWQTIRTIQDKYLQKQYLVDRGIPTAKSVSVAHPGGVKELENAVAKIGGCPVMVKARKEAYDGRGNFVLKEAGQIPEAVRALGGRELYVEQWVNFSEEVAVMVVKTKDSPDLPPETSTLAYPTVETVHEDSICKLTFQPTRKLTPDIGEAAQQLARRAVAGFQGKGIFGVEMFVQQEDNRDLLINEIAPRPHNSGHYTIEACPTSQFEAHLRVILGIPLTAAHLKSDRAAIMLNILGGADAQDHLRMRDAAINVPGAAIHMYGKGEGRPGRKMGHVTMTAKTLQEAEEKIAPLVQIADELRAERIASQNELERELLG